MLDRLAELKKVFNKYNKHCIYIYTQNTNQNVKNHEATTIEFEDKYTGVLIPEF